MGYPYLNFCLCAFLGSKTGCLLGRISSEGEGLKTPAWDFGAFEGGKFRVRRLEDWVAGLRLREGGTVGLLG